MDSREDTSETTVIWVLMEGPAVSLKGSPTVSPMTADLWASPPFSRHRVRRSMEKREMLYGISRFDRGHNILTYTRSRPGTISWPFLGTCRYTILIVNYNFGRFG